MDICVPSYDFTGKVVVVTGASRGIGFAVSNAFAKAGATLVAISQSDKVFSAAQEIGQDSGATVDAHQVDMCDFQGVAKVFDKIIQQFGRIDVLVNDAAIMGPTGPLESNEPAEWAKVIQVNLVGPFNAMKVVIPHMKRARAGSIINFSGGGAASPSPNFSAYGCSKAAVVRLTETVAQETRDFNIRVNVVAPGAIETDMLRTFFAGGGKARTVATIDKPVNLVLFLASDASRHLSGKFIHVFDNYLNFKEANLAEDMYTMRRVEP